MKPFDLEKALAGDPVVTRDGRSVTEVHRFKTLGGPYRLIAVIGGSLYRLTERGQYDSTGTNETDLFMAPKKRTVWINLYANGTDQPLTGYITYSSEAAANNAAKGSTNRIAGKAFPVEIEE
jgi:hypothetical protein